jgi:hypothetical protein
MAVQTVQTTSDVPEFLKPYYVGAPATGTPGQEGYRPEIKGIIDQAYQVYAPDYQTRYGAGLGAAGLEGKGRVAGLSPYQTQVGTELATMGTPSQFGLATQYGKGAADVFGTLSGVQAPTVGIGSITDTGVLGTYMSPYQKAVTDMQKDAAIRDAQRANLAQNLGAARQGVYGGARQLLATTERERALSSQLGSIEAQGLQNAYNAALAQFNVENQLGLTAQQANQQAALQAAQQRLGAGQGLAGLTSTMGQLGIGQQATDLDRLKTMGAYGDLQRGVQQQQLDVQYQDLMSRLRYPETQLGGISNILRGIPTTDVTQTTATPPPSFASQLAGMGLAGLGLYNMFNQPAR